jgi:hypothetical protein
MNQIIKNNLDGVHESKIHLHRSGFCGEYGLGRHYHRIRDVRRREAMKSSRIVVVHYLERGISKDDINAAIDTNADSPFLHLGQKSAYEGIISVRSN